MSGELFWLSFPSSMLAMALETVGARSPVDESKAGGGMPKGELRCGTGWPCSSRPGVTTADGIAELPFV